MCGTEWDIIEKFRYVCDSEKVRPTQVECETDADCNQYKYQMRYPKCGYYTAEKDGNIIQGYEGYMCLPHEMCGNQMEPDEKHPYNL